VILDNGAFENSASMSFERLAAITDKIEPQILVLPDVIGSWEATVGVTLNANAQVDLIRGRKPALMVVPHGRTVRECLKCLSAQLEIRPSYIALSRLYRLLDASRLQLLHEIRRFLRLEGIKFVKGIHLLGFERDLLLLEEFQQIEGGVPPIIGIDTAAPFTLALFNEKLNYETPSASTSVHYRHKPSNYYDIDLGPFEQKTLNLVKENVSVLVEVARGLKRM
jgi:hypothetical protein